MQPFREMATNSRISIIQVARRAGVHKSTVSRALRGDRQIPEKTRQRIELIARKLGYRPNPAMGALAAHGRRAVLRGGIPLAFVMMSREARATESAHLPGARQRAVSLGYALSCFDLTPQTNLDAFLRMLRARGVVGVILDRLQGDLGRFCDADWSPFAVVSAEGRLLQPRFHTVCQAVRQPFYYVVAQAVQRGYRRIGVALFKHDPPHPDDEARLAGLLLCQHRFVRRGLQILVHHQQGFSTESKQKLLSWLRQTRPDVLIGLNDTLYWWAKSDGWKIPEQLGFAALVVSEEPHMRLPRSGWREDYTGTGRTAVDLLDQMLRRGEFGVPEHPLEVLVPGQWQEGKTLPGPKAM
jgi:DNA-binding LacI/PurR family transcriptional regulator